MNLPGINVLQKFVTNNIREIGEGEPPQKDNAKLPLFGASALWHRKFQYDFCTLGTTSQLVHAHA